GACACTAYSVISRSTSLNPASSGPRPVGCAEMAMVAAAANRTQARGRIMPRSMRYYARTPARGAPKVPGTCLARARHVPGTLQCRAEADGDRRALRRRLVRAVARHRHRRHVRPDPRVLAWRDAAGGSARQTEDLHFARPERSDHADRRHQPDVRAAAEEAR